MEEYNFLFSNNDLVGYSDGTKVAAKATSCTKCVTASKVSSATSATYSSTSNYAKAIPSTVTTETRFSNGATIANGLTCNTITANTAVYLSPNNYASYLDVGQHITIQSDAYTLFLSGSSSSANFRCTDESGTLNLGTSNAKFNNIWAVNGTIQTSDRNEKTNFANFDSRHEKFFMLLLPKTYQFIKGTSGRTHFGFISQDVEEALVECGLSDLDFAGFCKDIKTEDIYEEVYDEKTGKIRRVYIREEDVLDENGNPVYIYSLRYEEFIALIVHMLQKLYSEHETLKDRVTDIEKRLSKLEV